MNNMFDILEALDSGHKQPCTTAVVWLTVYEEIYSQKL